MISGTTAWARFKIDVDMTLVSAIIFTYASASGAHKILLQKRYPDDTEYRDGMIWLPLTQQDTATLRSGGDIVLVELQFNLVSGAVAKSEIKKVCVSDTLATEYVDGSAPDDSQREGDVIEVALDDVIVVQTGGGGIYEESDPTVPEWAKQPEKPKYTASEVGALPANTKIPARTTDLINDSGFITKAAEDLLNYYRKSETYTRDEINERISSIPKFEISVVDTLPISGISETTIYLVKSGIGSDLYTEYIYTNGMWETLGSQRVDLTGYATESWVNVKLADYLPRTELQAAINAALDQAKASGEFKGDKGDKGDTGATGPQGEKGDTGAQGPQGEQGIQGEKGDTGAAGANGISATHSWNGTVLTVTSASGTSSADLKGAKGDKGDKGDTGNTGPAGSDASVTATNIKNALGYTPADAEKVSELSEAIDDLGKAEDDTAVLGDELITASGWALGAGWSGNLADGFTHASGSTEPLVFSPVITAGNLYQVTFKSSVAMTTTNLFVQVGDSTQFNLYAEDSTNNTGNVSIGVLAADASGLVFTPESTFTGTLTGISLREITGSYEAVQQYFDTNKAVTLEIHVTPRGLENVYIGRAVGEMNTSGRANVGIGEDALAKNTSGFWNTAIGTRALHNNIGGSRNIAIGYQSLRDNEVGQRNIGIGTFTMTRMKDGNWNVAIGSDSMNEATGGDRNVAIGFNTLTNNAGKHNVAVGADAMNKNTTGMQNIGVGASALGANTKGNNNVMLGYNAGIANTTGGGNTGVGWAALYKNTTGGYNTAFGYGAGKSITTGKYNIVVGVEPEVNATGNYQLNIGNLLKGSVNPNELYLLLAGGLRLPNIPTSAPGNDGVYAEEWVFTLEDGSTVTKRVLMK